MNVVTGDGSYVLHRPNEGWAIDVYTAGVRDEVNIVRGSTGVSVMEMIRRDKVNKI